MSEFIEMRIYDSSSEGFTFGRHGDEGYRVPFIIIEGKDLEYSSDGREVVSGTVTKITTGRPLSSISYEGGITVEELSAYDRGWYGPTLMHKNYKNDYIVRFEQIKPGAIIQYHKTLSDAEAYDPSTNVATSGADKTIFADDGGSVLRADYKDSNDHLIGRAGDDEIHASSGSDTLTGGQGKDTFHVALGSKWSEEVQTTITDFKPGEDVLEISVDDSSVSSLDDLSILSLPWVTYVVAPNGNQIALDNVSSLNKADIKLTVNPTPTAPINGVVEGYTEGTEFDDTILAASKGQWVLGKEGDDLLKVVPGSDAYVRFYGGEGDDTLLGGDKGDVLHGGLNGQDNRKGNDYLSGGAGDDSLYGGTYLDGGEGDDYLYAIGNGPMSILDGGAGNDTLQSGHGEDWIVGGDGQDWLSYGSSRGGVVATLSSSNADGRGEARNDMVMGVENIIGSKYSDALTGDDGDNIIHGGQGAGATDVLTGMGGADTFMFGWRNIVTDYEDGVDRISLENYKRYDLSFSDLTISQKDDSVEISFRGDYSWNRVILQDTDISQINESDFIF